VWLEKPGHREQVRELFYRAQAAGHYAAAAGNSADASAAVAAYVQPGQGIMVPDYMIASVVVTVISIFCCWAQVATAFGVVAIVKSSQANGKKFNGDFIGALQDANSAQTWLFWAGGLDIAAALIATACVIFSLDSL